MMMIGCTNSHFTYILLTFPRNTALFTTDDRQNVKTEELLKLFKLSSSMFNGHFTSREHRYENCSSNRWSACTFLESFAELRKAAVCFVMHVRPSVYLSARKDSAPTERIFMKFCIWIFFRKSVEVVHVSSRSDKNNGYYTLILCTFMIISVSVLRIGNVSDNSCRKTRSRILCSITFFSETAPLMRKCGKYCRAGQATDDNIIRCMLFAF